MDCREKRDIDNLMKAGTVYWLTGLSGAGKTTIGNLLVKGLRRERDNIVSLDGDVLRNVYGDHWGHTIEDRKSLALSYARLCQLLANQGFDVVCSTISMFPEIWEWCHANIQNYKMIYLQVEMETLFTRDQKGLYSRALQGEVKDVMGVDVPVDEPVGPKIVVNNNGDREPDIVVTEILRKIRN